MVEVAFSGESGGGVAQSDPLFLRFQLRFIGSDERANLVGNFQQS
jgi:hypothetical protein